MMIDDAMNGLRSVLDNATQRTADAIGNSRSYVERARLRAKLNEAYRMLGMAEYEASINGVSSMEQINGLIGRITDLRAAMAEINRGIQHGGKRQSAFCPNCGKELNSTESFCPGCGAKLG